MVTRVGVLLLLAVASISGADWPQFRGANRDNIATETGLYRSWPKGGPRVLWKTPVCEGYAGAAIKAGILYLNDYDAAKKEHLVRAISMADGKDLWRWSYPVEIRPNHGITRTVPSVGSQFVFSLDPKCRFHALDLKTGKLAWQKNLVQDYKATIPGWYAGQNPLLDGTRVVLATGGRSYPQTGSTGDGYGLAAVLGVLLKLPPTKQALASKQFKSRYLEYLITHVRV